MKLKVFISYLVFISFLVACFFNYNNIKALALGTTDLTIHYKQGPHSTKDWNLWVWTENSEGKVYEFMKTDTFGEYTTISLNGNYNRVGFIIRTDNWEKDGGDRWIENIQNGRAEVWVISEDDTLYLEEPVNEPTIKSAVIDQFNEITLTTNQPFSIQDTKVLVEGVKIKSVLPYDGTPIGQLTKKVTIRTATELSLNKSYTVSLAGYGTATTRLGKVVRTKQFDDMFYYEGHDLGNSYTRSKTQFRVWAPTASQAELITYEDWKDKEGTPIPMTKSVRGTWTAALPGDQNGLFYTYKVKIGETWTEAVDPYVRATSVNGDRGVVINLSNTNPKDWRPSIKPKLANPEDAILYELHIRDLSSHSESGIKNKGKYIGVAETGTRGPNGVTTGLDYIKELGVTHVQFLPFADFEYVDETKANEPHYNWGYATKNFNVPEGSYSVNPFEPNLRITELKQMIQAVHDQNLRVVMDVVYNHTFDVNSSNFHKLVPGYYYRYNEDGSLANGTGVGNDTASERKMMRKFMVDSVVYWAKEYNIDGFRFDLMGIHDIKTMNKIRESLDQIDPSILVHGEGWDLNTPLPQEQKANQKNAKWMDGIAHFNDNIRDGLKGSTFEDTKLGFVNGAMQLEERIKQGIAAGLNYEAGISSYQDPEQVLTYVEAHDNLTLWDKLKMTNPQDTEKVRAQMQRLSTSIVLTSQGLPFIHAGQEFLRTKDGVHDSYNYPDSINQLDWNRRSLYDNEVKYIRGLIDIRKNHHALRLNTGAQIRRNLTFTNTPMNTVAYTIQDKNNGKKSSQLFIAHNANRTSVEITLPSVGPWIVLADHERAGNKALYIINGKKVTIPALSSLVLETNQIDN